MMGMSEDITVNLGYSGKPDYWVAKLVGEGEIKWAKVSWRGSVDVARTIQQTL